MLTAFLNGFGIGASLIIAIGSQNAFVLVQGVKRNHHMAVGALCALLDLLLISAGVLGLGSLIESNYILKTIAGIGGFIFLAIFGLNSLRRSLTDHSLTLDVSAQSESLSKTLLQTLAISLLNPHVYLDTVVMLGSISATCASDVRIFFGAGAGASSLLWFFGLAQAGKVLAPLFSKPKAWRILHFLVCIMVWWVAYGLGVTLWNDFNN